MSKQGAYSVLMLLGVPTTILDSDITGQAIAYTINACSAVKTTLGKTEQLPICRCTQESSTTTTQRTSADKPPSAGQTMFKVALPGLAVHTHPLPPGPC